MRKLWKKLFSRQSQESEISLHIAGATVRHRNPFEDLIVPRNCEELSWEFIEKWVTPFYMAGISNLTPQQESDFIEIYHEIKPEIVGKLLGDFNWRTRIVGAYFAALRNFVEFEETIGNQLLKSEVCYAGGGYCLALANFGTEKSKDILKRYLDYYLTRKDLWFDQHDAFAALFWIDKKEAEKYESLWIGFAADKPHWNLEQSKEYFAESMQNIERIKQIAKEKV
ncbi:MAG: DUF6000 family protein [Actinomycetota bacterium]